MQFSAYMILQSCQRPRVPAPIFRMFATEKETRKKRVRLGLRLPHRHAGLQTANQSKRISPFAYVVHHQRNDEINFQSRRKDRTKVESRRKHSNNRHRLTIERDRLPNDRRIGCKLTSPEWFAQQHRRPPAFLTLICGKQAPKQRFNSKRMKEIAHHRDTGNGQRFATASQPEVVVSRKCEVPCYVLERMVLCQELVISIRRVSRT